MLELNCETDFVANTDDFKSLGNDIIKHIKNSEFSQLDDILNEKFINDNNKKLKDVITDAVGRLGENIVLSRFCKYSVESGLVVSYIHPGSKLGVLLKFNSDQVSDKDSLNDFGKEISMHIAATSPISVSIDDVSSEIIAKEREIFSDQAKKSGK